MKQELRRFRVASWDTYQHYKNRRPTWIKLHVSLLDDYEFMCLQPASRLLAICTMLLAAKTDNHIPGDPRWFAKVLHLDETPSLDELVSSGFLTPCDCEKCLASEVLADCKQSAMPETETETEGKGVVGVPSSVSPSLPRKVFRIPGTEEVTQVTLDTQVTQNTGGGLEGGRGRAKKAKTEDVPIPLVLDTPDFRVAWFERWLPWRRDENHHKVTPFGARLSLEELTPFGPTAAIAAIDKSIANDWRGLFPEKEQGNNGSGTYSSQARPMQPKADPARERPEYTEDNF